MWGSKKRDKSLEIEEIIALAIKSGDKTVFFENYSKQSRRVIKELRERGYEVVLREPNAEMLEEGKKELSAGLHNPRDVARLVYKSMIGVVREE